MKIKIVFFACVMVFLVGCSKTETLEDLISEQETIPRPERIDIKPNPDAKEYKNGRYFIVTYYENSVGQIKNDTELIKLPTDNTVVTKHGATVILDSVYTINGEPYIYYYLVKTEKPHKLYMENTDSVDVYRNSTCVDAVKPRRTEKRSWVKYDSTEDTWQALYTP